MKNAYGLTSKARLVVSALSFALLCAFGVHAQTAPVKKPATVAPAKPTVPIKPVTPSAVPQKPTAAKTSEQQTKGSNGSTGGNGSNRPIGATTKDSTAKQPITTDKQGTRVKEPITVDTQHTRDKQPDRQSSKQPGNEIKPAVLDRKADRREPPKTPVDRVKEDGGHFSPKGSQVAHTEKGFVRRGPDNHPRDIYVAGRKEDIHYNRDGGRRVVMERPGGGRAYYEPGRPGYLGHPFLGARGERFDRRTYYGRDGRSYERFYRPYNYHGYALDVYVPNRYFATGYYGYLYGGWGVSAPYSWGFASAPWYGVYGGYFQPYPVYATPSLWLTDYMISQSLADGYAAQQANGGVPPPYSGPALSANVKQQIAEEVQNDIKLENFEAKNNTNKQVPDPDTSGIGQLLSDGKPHVFVADKEVDVVQSTNQQECAITDGEVVVVSTPPADADTTAKATVLASRGGKDCPMNAEVAIGLDDLSEMNNHLRETIDRGMAELQKKLGSNGLPKAPPSTLLPGTISVVAENDPPPEPADDKELQKLAAQSLKDEGELVKETEVSSAPGTASTETAAPSTGTVSLVGMSLKQVEDLLGDSTSHKKGTGKSTIYQFGGDNVTVVDGKVTYVTHVN